MNMIGHNYLNRMNHNLFNSLMYVVMFVQFVSLCNFAEIDWQLALAAMRDGVSGSFVPLPTFSVKN